MSYADYTSCKVSMQRLGLIVNMAIYDYSISPRFPIHRFTLRNDISTTPKAARGATRPANNPYFVNRDFWACLEKISNDPSPTQQRTLEIILDMIDHNIFDFTAKEMREKTGMSKKEFNGVRECMKRNGLISVKSNEAGMIPRRCVLVRYRLTVPLPIHSERSKIQPLSEKPVRIPASAILSPDVFWGRIDRMEKSRSLPISQGATIIRRMIENGITTYTRRSFMAYSGMSGDEYARCRPGITDRGLVYDLTNERRTGPQRPGIYAFTLAGLKLSKEMPLNSRTPQKEKNRLPAK